MWHRLHHGFLLFIQQWQRIKLDEKKCTFDFNYVRSTRMMTWNSNIRENKKTKTNLFQWILHHWEVEKSSRICSLAFQFSIADSNAFEWGKKPRCWKHKNRTNAFESKQKPWPMPHRKQTKELYSFVWICAVSAGVMVNCTFGWFV